MVMMNQGSIAEAEAQPLAAPHVILRDLLPPDSSR